MTYRKGGKRFVRCVLACTLLFAATHSMAAGPADPLDIYVVRGDAARLDRFKSDLEDWKGGEFLPRLSNKAENRYWAYPARSAPDARLFMFGSMAHGLKLDFEEYDQEAAYPSERALLRTISGRCGIKPDTFFIEPDRTLFVKLPADRTPAIADCVTRELKAATSGDMMPIKILGTNVPVTGR